jgi:hypothetical protein
MPESQWNERVRVFNPTESLDSGLPLKTYVFVDSGEPDGAFSMSKGVPSGRDSIIAGQRDFKADGVFGCGIDVPVQDNSMLRHLDDEDDDGNGRLYRVRKREPARRKGQYVLIAESAALDTDETVVLTGEP